MRRTSRALPCARNSHGQGNIRRRIREGLQREFTREEVKKRVANINDRKGAAGADKIVNDFAKVRGEKECLP